MKVLGNEVVSRSTQVSSRALWLIAGTVFLVVVLGLEVAGMKIANIMVGERFFDAAAIILLALLANHFVNWRSDVTSFSSWNLVGATQDKSDLMEQSVVSRLEATTRYLRQLELQSGDEKGPPAADIKRLADSVGELVSDIGNGNSRARFYLVWWHGYVPMLFAIIAFGSCLLQSSLVEKAN